MTNIRISEKHGVNPSLTVCVVCGESVGVALFGRIKGDEQAPRHVPDEEPCDKCRTQIEDAARNHGFVFICIKDEYEELARTPARITPWQFFDSWFCVRQEVAENILSDSLPDGNIAFIKKSLGKKLGFYEAAKQ